MSFSSKLAASGDFVSLPGDDDYQLYFEQLKRVFEVLDNWCAIQGEGGNEESRVLRLFLSRMLTSVELLRERQRFRPDRNLKIDLNESGLPHFIGLEELNTDLRNCEDRLKALPSMASLKEAALNRIFESPEEPSELLSIMAERRYMEKLLRSDFLGPFRFGGIQLRGRRGNRRHYLCAWSCFNATDNMLYIHTMLFEQDIREDPLDKRLQNYEELKRIARQEGSRVPPLAVLAVVVDEQMDSIHPKILKRTRIGPIALPRFTFDQGPLALMVKGLGKPSEFSIELATETIFSATEVIKEKGGWLRPDKVREVFAIPETDLECFKARVSRIHKYVIMPHHLMQHMKTSDAEAARLYEAHEKFVYDEQLSIYGI